MISKFILIVLLNHLEQLGAYAIEVSNNMVTFCTSIEKDSDVYDIFGFLGYRLKSYYYKTHISYVIQ